MKKYLVLTILIFVFIAFVALGSVKLTKDITPPSPYQLKVSATSTPTEQFIFIEQAQINQQLQLPIIHRVLTEGKSDKRAKGKTGKTKLSTPNVYVVLPTPTAVNQQIILLPMTFNNNNTPLMAKFTGPQNQQYWLTFKNSNQSSILVSESNGSGGYRWVKSAASSPNILNLSDGGGKFTQDIPGLIEFLKGIPEVKGFIEGFYNFYEWLDSGEPPAALTDASIIKDMTTVIQSFIEQGQAQQIQGQFNAQQSIIFGDIPSTMSTNFQFQEYGKNNGNADIHGVLTNGLLHRTQTYQNAFDVAKLTGEAIYNLENSMIQFSTFSNFSNSSGQNTQPSEWWLAFSQFMGYYFGMIQLASQFNPDPYGTTSNYTMPWASDLITAAQTRTANTTYGLPQLYRLYYQFINQFQSNISWQEVTGDGKGDTYCCYDNGVKGVGCGTVVNPGAQQPACAATYYSMVNVNGTKFIPPSEVNNVPSCVPNPQGVLHPVPLNVVASADGTGAYTCVTTTDSAALDMIRTSFTTWLESQWNEPRQMIDNFAELAGLNCQSYSTNQIWSCTAIGSSYTENGINFPYGNWFGLTNGSASAETSQQGVHLMCASVTNVSLDSSTFYKHFLYKVQSFTENFSLSSYTYWNPSFTTNGGCCPPDTAYIRSCWEGSLSESVGSQSAGVANRRQFWCVTNSVNNQVTTTTDAIKVQVCEVNDNTATVSAGLYPFAQTPLDGFNFSSFFMPSRASQWYFNSEIVGESYKLGFGLANINLLNTNSNPDGIFANSYGAASAYAPGGTGTCIATPETGNPPYPAVQGQNVGGILAPLASNSGFPNATSTAAVPQLLGYAFPCTDIPTPWIIPEFAGGTQTAVVTDGTKTVRIQTVDAVNAILSMPQPSYSTSFTANPPSQNNLFGLPSPSITTASNPWIATTSIVFWDQYKNILPAGTTVSATSTVTAIVLENQYIVTSGNARDTSSCYAPGTYNRIVPYAICNPCPIASEFVSFNWTSYSDFGAGFSAGSFSAPYNWKLIFAYATP